MNPFMNTNEASNNLHRKEQDATHKAAIGKLTEMVRAAQQSTLTELQAENAALKEQVAQLESDNKMLCESFSTASVNMKKTISTLQSKSAALVDALGKIIGHDKWVMFQRCPDCDYNCAGQCKDTPISEYGKIAEAALAAFKEPKG